MLTTSRFSTRHTFQSTRATGLQILASLHLPRSSSPKHGHRHVSPRLRRPLNRAIWSAELPSSMVHASFTPLHLLLFPATGRPYAEYRYRSIQRNPGTFQTVTCHHDVLFMKLHLMKGIARSLYRCNHGMEASKTLQLSTPILLYLNVFNFRVITERLFCR